jgi:LytS/YehU family sensor histidine kinase
LERTTYIEDIPLIQEPSLSFLSRSISILCASYRGDERATFLKEFRTLARQYEGVDDVVLLAAEEDHSQPRPGKMRTAIPIRVMDEVVGQLHVYFRIKAFQDSSPMPLARFLAHHLTLALHSAALHHSNRALNAELASLDGKVSEHRMVERARGILESQRLIPAGDAKRLLGKVSRESGRNLREIAKSIVASERRSAMRLRRNLFGLGAPNHVAR